MSGRQGTGNKKCYFTSICELRNVSSIELLIKKRMPVKYVNK